MKLKVTGAQMAVTPDVDANVEQISAAIGFAASEKADLLLTPEGSVSGYTPAFDAARVTRAVDKLARQARAAHVGLALGTCFVEPRDNKCYNQVRFYTPDGDYLGFHSKTLTCGSWDDPPTGEINDYTVAPLRTFCFREITVGALICNDLWANVQCTPVPDPHLTQQLAKKGARIIFHAVNGGRDGTAWSQVNWHYHESNLLMRARAGGLWIVTVDSCHPLDLPCSAPSGVVAPDGTWACRARPQGFEHFVYTVELDEVA